ncbi:MAG: hypothetical protein HY711_10105 [Candidatus Melainabacteria bacterium]|nr:hypothetical protein [Candidatus Melainabacteria bacterium]
MRIAPALLSVIMVLELTCWPRAASAATVNYAPTGTQGFGVVDGQVPVNKVGELLLADAQVMLKGSVIDVEGVPEGATKKATVLSGVVFNAKVTGTGKSRRLSGYAYFRQGPSLTAIDDPATEEMIDVEDGGVVGGHILAVNHERIEMQTPTGVREVSVEKIRRICSPRIFAFTMPVAVASPVATGQGFQGECSQIKFERTAKACRRTKDDMATDGQKRPRLCCIGFVAAGARPQEKAQQASQAGIGKIVAITAVMVAVAAAIAIPIAVPIAVANRNRSHGPKPEEALMYYWLTHPAPPPSPPPASPPPSGP